MANKIAEVNIVINTPETVGTAESTEYNFTALDRNGEIIETYQGASVALIAIDLANAILCGLYCKQQGIEYSPESED